MIAFYLPFYEMCWVTLPKTEELLSLIKAHQAEIGKKSWQFPATDKLEGLLKEELKVGNFPSTHLVECEMAFIFHGEW
jgi:hypothetical protein